MAVHVGLKNEFTEDKKYHSLMTRLIYSKNGFVQITFWSKLQNAIAFHVYILRGNLKHNLKCIFSLFSIKYGSNIPYQVNRMKTIVSSLRNFMAKTKTIYPSLLDNNNSQQGKKYMQLNQTYLY